MVQLLNLVVHNVAAPALHNSGFAVSLCVPSCESCLCQNVILHLILIFLFTLLSSYLVFQVPGSLCYDNIPEWKIF